MESIRKLNIFGPGSHPSYSSTVDDKHHATFHFAKMVEQIDVARLIITKRPCQGQSDSVLEAGRCTANVMTSITASKANNIAYFFFPMLHEENWILIFR